MQDLLREYLALQLERLRQDIDPKTGKPLDKFDVRAFKEFKSPRTMLSYAYDRLRLLGEGTSRAIFLLNSKTVLKLATSEAGVEQNRVETEISMDEDARTLIAAVKAHHPKHYWLVSELVRPIVGNDFEELTGMTFDAFRQTIIKLKKGEKDVGRPERELVKDHERAVAADAATGAGTPTRKSTASPLDSVNMQFIDAVMELITKHDLYAPDVIKRDSWGKTADGRVVLLDYGFDDDIKKAFYMTVYHAKHGGREYSKAHDPKGYEQAVKAGAKPRTSLSIDPEAVDDYTDDDDVYSAKIDAKARRTARRNAA